MKLTYFSRFPLLAGLMALWLSLSGAQSATGLPAAEYARVAGADAEGDDYRQKCLAIFRRQLSAHHRAGQCGKQIPLDHHVGQRLLSGRHDRGP